MVGAVLNFGAALGGFVIQGESRDGVVLRLDDNASGFGNPNSPMVLLDYFAGNGTNNAFVNMLENLTVDVGSGNPGAIGVRFHANNTGAIRNVTIRSSDPQLAGWAGLEAVKNTNGPWLIRGLEVIGFDFGLNLGNAESGRHLVSVQDLRLSGQRTAAIQLNHLKLNAFNVYSYNEVPLVMDLSRSGLINFINLELVLPQGRSNAGAAIRSLSPVTVRNVAANGYAPLVAAGSMVLLDELAEEEEWHSHKRNFLWEKTPARSLNLPIEQAPEPAWAAPDDWAIVDVIPAGGDNTRVIREAMQSGKSTIVFMPGVYRISDTIRIPPHVQRIAGQWALLRTETGLTGDGRPVFELGPSDHETVVIEKLRGRFDRQLNPNPLLVNGSNSDVVLRDIFWVSGPVYRNEPTRGRLFIENVHSLPGSQNNPLDIPAFSFRGQDVWAWQWNPEMLHPHAVVDGGRFFAFGWKVGEMRGPIVEVRNHGYAELIGGSMNVTHDTLDIQPEDTIMLYSVDGNVSANFIEHAQLTGGGSGWGRQQFVAIETRNGETRELLTTDPSIMHNTFASPQFGAVIPLYTGYFEQDNPANQAPVIEFVRANSDLTGFQFSFTANATDPDAFPAAEPVLHWRVVAGPDMARTHQHTGNTATFTFDSAGDYLVEVSATDGALEVSETLPVRVLPRKFSARLGRDDVYRYVDNAPQDGVANLFHPALLQVGDDATNAHSHLRVDLNLAALQGSRDRIQRAELLLRIDALNGLDALRVAYATTDSFGTFTAGDFGAERVVFATVPLEGVSNGDTIAIDVRPAILHALDHGISTASVWFQSDFANDGVARFVRFASTVAADVNQRPLFVVDFAAAGLRESSVPVAANRFFHPVFGQFHDFAQFIYHYPLGWLYVHDLEDAHGGRVIYSFSNPGWKYFNPITYPWVFDFGLNDWVMAESGV